MKLWFGIKNPGNLKIYGHNSIIYAFGKCCGLIGSWNFYLFSIGPTLLGGDRNVFCDFSAKLDWNEAESFAALLCEHSKWSRTIYTYQRAVVMLMRDKKHLTPAELQTIENLMR